MEVNIHKAKTHLSELLERVAMGEEVIIAKAGNPVAKLVPIKRAARKKQVPKKPREYARGAKKRKVKKMARGTAKR